MNKELSANSKKGFSIVEILISVAVMAVILTISFTAFMGFNQRQVLPSVTSDIVSLIADARSLTLASKDDSVYGIHFENTKVVLFKGSTYSSADPDNKTIVIDGAVSAVTVLSGGGQDIVFQRLTGALSQVGSTTLSLNRYPSQKKTILIYTTGVTEILEELNVPDPFEVGLIAYWKLDLVINQVTKDATVNKNDGTLIGFPDPTSPVTGFIGQALNFDGLDDYVNIGPMNSVKGNELTISAWVRSDNLYNCSNRDCRIVSKAVGTAEQDHYFTLSTVKVGTGGSAQNRLQFLLKTDNNTDTVIATVTGNLSKDIWTHVAATYDGALVRLYVDGWGVENEAKTGNITTNPAVSTWIGGNPPGATDKPWDGTIDDVRIYNRALLPHEILALYEQGISAPLSVSSAISTGSDDAEECLNTTVDLSSSQLDMVDVCTTQEVGLRFQNIDIPQGATITNAIIQFTVRRANTSPTDLILYGEAIDNAVSFLNINGNISSRTKTTASVDWNVYKWDNNVVNLSTWAQRTPNLSAIIQEIVDRPLWLSGNSIVIIVTGSGGPRKAKSFDMSDGGQAWIYITYEP